MPSHKQIQPEPCGRFKSPPLQLHSDLDCRMKANDSFAMLTMGIYCKLPLPSPTMFPKKPLVPLSSDIATSKYFCSIATQGIRLFPNELSAPGRRTVTHQCCRQFLACVRLCLHWRTGTVFRCRQSICFSFRLCAEIIQFSIPLQREKPCLC